MEGAERLVPGLPDGAAGDPLQPAVGRGEHIQNRDAFGSPREGESAADSPLPAENPVPREHPEDLVQVSRRDSRRGGDILRYRRPAAEAGEMDDGAESVLGGLGDHEEMPE